MTAIYVNDKASNPYTKQAAVTAMIHIKSDELLQGLVFELPHELCRNL